MYNNKWEKYNEYDSKNPTFSSSLLDKINKSLKNNPKNEFDDDLKIFKSKIDGRNANEEKISSLRRASLVEKWMDNKKVSKKSSKVKKSYNTLLQEFDVQDTLFFGTTSTSSSSSEAEYCAGYTHPRQHRQPRVTCFAPPMPKPVRTRPIESKFLEQLEEKNGHNIKDEEILKSRSRALKIYSNFKNLKQPISPGVKLTSFINSLFTKNNTTTTNKNKNKNKNSKDDISVISTDKIKTTSYSACTTPTSYSRSCLSNKQKKFQDDVDKRTVRFCPISVILDEDSRPCGHKSVFEDPYKQISSSKFKTSLSKKYEEMKNNNKKLEEVALDLLSGYCWDSRMSSKSQINNNNNNDNKNNNQISKGRVNEGDYGGNYGINYVQREDNNCDYENDDVLSCSSSDLFELDHLNFIGNELPVYETTQFNPKLH
ncbi:hypothetical protein RND81_03G114300 [Saponaria officinalis]|uniref:Protein BIG GRAIN 1-like B n=1 Tax=Saponaria officinalis TaxID=3572 RepID=A0AAW1M6C4_SAPOF